MQRLSLDPEHVPQKKNKIITHFPNGKAIPKEMQKMVGKGLIELKDNSLHGKLLKYFSHIDENNGPMISDKEYELYFIQAVSSNIFIYDSDDNIIWYTKDSNPLELTPEYYV